MAAQYLPSRDFDTGEVFGLIFRISIARFFPLLGLILVSVLTVSLFMVVLISLFLYLFIGQQIFGFSAIDFIMAVLVFLISSASLLPYGAVSHATVQIMQDKPWSITSAIGVSMQALLPLIIIFHLAAMGIALGYFLLIVPGIFLSIIWCIVVPVRVVEGLGVFETFSRSAALTKGNLGALLGLGIIFIVFYLVLNVLLSFVTSPLGAAFGIGDPNASFAALIFIVPVMLLLSLSTLIPAFVAPSVVYMALRQSKEGGTGRELADIFG